MKVEKRNGTIVEYDFNKVKKAVLAAFEDNTRTKKYYPKGEIDNVLDTVKQEIEDCVEDTSYVKDGLKLLNVEEIQDIIEKVLMDKKYNDVLKAFLLYRERHSETRFIKDRIDYMQKYSESHDNAASSSETDANANVIMKNVANLEGEVYKTTNRIIQRQRMKEELNILYPEVAKQYAKDLEHHIIYTHDEASTPVLKQYCMAISLFPLMTEGVGNIDGVTPTPPNDLQSFSGQITNLIFLSSSQCKGAVAVGEYFVVLNYYVIAEFGKDWYNHLDEVISVKPSKLIRTVRSSIVKAFKQFVWGVNQPAGNRSYQSPFTNISYFDSTYYKAMFENFVYPDGTKPEWKAVDTLQRMFMNWFNRIRLKQVLTFPVETFAMVYDPNTQEIIDKKYRDLCAEMYAKGHSFFTYISDSADSLASCCRLRNEFSDNTFSPTSGLTGIMTGSVNVITLNINRILQDYVNENTIKFRLDEKFEQSFKDYLITILERVYKYQIAFKTMLYDLEDKGMLAASNGGYIKISKLYSTIGINGLNEAALYLSLKVNNNPEYIHFLQVILSTIKESNKKHSITDKKRPFLFNSEVVPAEGLGGKNYNWDKEDGYWVPEDENLYNSYFYNAHDDTSVLDKFILHGKQTYKYTDGGSAAHINLEDHLSKEQYLKLIDFAVKNGTSYFTFNIPNSQCDDCGYIVKSPITTCPKCGSKNITWYTRVIGYLRPIKAFGNDRQIEAEKRTYSSKKELKG